MKPIHLYLESLLQKGVVQVDESQEVTHGREHTFADMVSSNFSCIIQGNKDRSQASTHLGNLSASNTTQLTPSRTSAEAVYEPPGPPPITNTVVSWGMDIAV